MIVWLTAFFWSAVIPAALAAAEGGHGHHAPSITDLAWPVLNFSLFLALVWKLAWPAVRDGLAERRREIERKIEAAETDVREAKAILDEVRSLRAEEEAETARIRKELADEAEAERRQLVAAAEQAATRIRDDARRLGEYEAARAADEIRRAVAEEAARRAGEVVRSSVAEAEEERFLDEFLASLPAEGLR